jgi:hypothetical protein
MSGLQIGAALAAVLVAVLGFFFSRKDAKTNAEKIVKSHPANPSGLAAFRQWMRDTKAKRDFQP